MEDLYNYSVILFAKLWCTYVQQEVLSIVILLGKTFTIFLKEFIYQRQLFGDIRLQTWHVGLRNIFKIKTKAKNFLKISIRGMGSGSLGGSSSKHQSRDREIFLKSEKYLGFIGRKLFFNIVFYVFCKDLMWAFYFVI